MSETRQRWRIAFARQSEAAALVHRDVWSAWDTALRASGLPLSFTEGTAPKSRIAFAAPVPVGWLAERELLDMFLVKQCRAADVRGAVELCVPAGHAVVDLHDVWVGAQAVAGQVVASDVRLIATPEPPLSPRLEQDALTRAVEGLMNAQRIERPRDKGGSAVVVDIRPRLTVLRAGPIEADGSFGLWMRLRHLAEGGVGRPEEVVDALGESLGSRLVARSIVRERLHLADDRDA